MHLQLKEKHQDEINKFPLRWAFSDEQFKKAMESLGLKETDTDKIVSIGGGGFMRKTDAPAFEEMMNRQEAERAEAFKDDQYVYDAFVYELGNHEFCITYEYEPTLAALGLTEEEVARDVRLLKLLKKAKDDYLAGVEEW